MMSCSKCHSTCILKARPNENELFGAACDICKEVICKKCSKITTTEAHAIAVKEKRVILFLCSTCKERLSDLHTFGNLLDSYDKLKCETYKKDAEIESLNMQVEDLTKDMHEEIGKLSVINKNKDNYIKRLQRRTQDFEDSVSNNELLAENKIKTLEREKVEINKEILSLMEKYKELQEEKQLFEERLICMSRELADLKHITVNMKTTIETLTEDNNTYVVDLKTANQELFALKDILLASQAKESPIALKKTIDEIEIENDVPSSFMTPDDELCLEVLTPAPTDLISLEEELSKANDEAVHGCTRVEEQKKKKVVFLTDDCGKHMYNYLIDSFGDDFYVQIICKPFAKFNDVASSIDCLVNELTMSDFVIVLAGVNNDDISVRNISSLANKCFFTNLLLCNIPVNVECRNAYRFYHVNNKISNSALNLGFYSNNVKYLNLENEFDQGCYFRNSIYLNRRGRRLLANLIFKKVINFSIPDRFRTLLQVKVDDCEFSPECLGGVELLDSEPILLESQAHLSRHQCGNNFLDKHSLPDPLIIPRMDYPF